MTTSQSLPGPAERVVVVSGQDWDEVVTAARQNAGENAGGGRISAGDENLR